MTTTTIGPGQTTSGVTVNNGDTLTVERGGTAIGITVETGGSMTVLGGGVALDTVVSAATSGFAYLSVDSGGTASGTTLDAEYDDYAEFTVESGGSATDTTVGTAETPNGASPIFIVELNAQAANTIVSSNGFEELYIGSGQTTGIPVVSSNVLAILENGANTSGLVVNGGACEMSPGATATSTVLADSFLTVATGATAVATQVNGGFFEVLGGTASGTVLNGASDTTGSSGVTHIGTNTIYTTAPDETVYDEVFDGGTTTSTMVNGEAFEIVSSSTVISSTVQYGGQELLSAGATASSTVLANGGTQSVGAGATAINTTVNSGGIEILQSGGTITDTVLNIGGTIDLTNDPYISGSSATLDAANDVLTIAGITPLQLAGAYADDTFALTSDGSGGMNVTLTSPLKVVDTTSDKVLLALGESYTGPVSGLQNEYLNIATDGLAVTVTTNNWFIHTGSGEDAIAVTGGTNVLDGGTGSNFLLGGTGNGFDTFFVDDRNAAAPIWSTVVNFHAGDAATIWGVTSQDFNLSWLDGQGAAGYTGLTLTATAAGIPSASLTLAGFTKADLADGKLAVSFGTSNGSAYMYIQDKS